MDVKAALHQAPLPAQAPHNGAQMPMQAPNAALQQPIQKPSQPQNRAPPANEPRKVKFSVGRDYQVMTVIGEGAYGVVVRAVHRASGREVAIKKVSLVVTPLRDVLPTCCLWSSDLPVRPRSFRSQNLERVEASQILLRATS
jgi:serine/threonine protein kinase